MNEQNEKFNKEIENIKKTRDPTAEKITEINRDFQKKNQWPRR